MRPFASAGAAFAALGLSIGLAVSLAATSGSKAGGLAALAQPPVSSSLASQRIYFVMPDRYANGDPSNDRGGLSGTRAVTGLDSTDPAYYHGGDLRGLTQGLQRIKELGFTALWVTPVLKQDPFENGSAAYHGYWGLDFTTVDPHLGTDEDFARFVGAAHALRLKVYLDVVVNHTADVIQLTGGSSYSDVPYRDCHGKRFDPARYVTAKRFPCLKAAGMPEVPLLLPADRNKKKPAWLNDPLNYHDRGNVDFGSCSQECFEQGDFFGLDDLFTEKPNVMSGLAQIYAGWISRFHVDGFRVDTAKHVNAAFFRLWVPKILSAARAAGIRDFPIFGEVTLNDAIDLAPYVRDRGLPSVLDFPFQEAAVNYASGVSGAKAISQRLTDDDYFRTASGVDPAFPTFLGNHDMGRAAQQIAARVGGPDAPGLQQRVALGYDVLYLLRGAPIVLYGDEVGMIGSGGDQQARQDMFPTQVADWQTQPRVGSPPIGTGSSLDVTGNPVETELRALARLRDANPALSTGPTVVRVAKQSVLVVSRIDVTARHEYVVAFNASTTAATVTVSTSTPSSSWTPLLGPGGSASSGAGGRLTISVPPVSAVLLRADVALPARPIGKVIVRFAPDSYSDYEAVSVRLQTADPVTVTFAVRRARGSWQRLATDDTPPYRAFLDPARFRHRERVQVAAVVRSSRGAVAVSTPLSVVVRKS